MTADLTVITEQRPYERDERKEFGTLREVAIATGESLAWKGGVPTIEYANAKNMAKSGQILINITENVAKNPRTRTVHVSKEISDKIRRGIVNRVDLLDTIVVLHENKNGTGAVTSKPYPLCVTPTEGESEAVKQKTALLNKTKVLASAVAKESVWEDLASDMEDLDSLIARLKQ